MLTFAVIACNQEQFIREAVESAFAQTYSPLEIILSDDCSEDRTFEIMRELASGYRGPHRVLLNRNSTRRSIGGHVNKVLELSHGDFIVGADGDDVSLPHRTQNIYETWERSGRQATYIYSNFIQIDKNGQTIEQIFKWITSPTVEREVEPLAHVQTRQPGIFGCGHAYSRRLFQIFGNLPEHIIHEDNVLAFRSILNGRRLLVVNEPLLKYRLHDNNVFLGSRTRSVNLKSLEHQEDRMRRNFRNRETMYEAFVADLKTARERKMIGQAEFEASAAEAVRMGRRYALQREFFERGLIGKCRILSSLKKDGLDQTDLKQLDRRLFPQPLLLRLMLVRNYYILAQRQPRA